MHEGRGSHGYWMIRSRTNRNRKKRSQQPRNLKCTAASHLTDSTSDRNHAPCRTVAFMNMQFLSSSLQGQTAQKPHLNEASTKAFKSRCPVLVNVAGKAVCQRRSLALAWLKNSNRPSSETQVTSTFNYERRPYRTEPLMWPRDISCRKLLSTQVNACLVA